MIAISEDIAKPAPAVTVILQPSDGFSAPSAQLENKNMVNFTAKSKTWHQGSTHQSVRVGAPMKKGAWIPTWHDAVSSRYLVVHYSNSKTKGPRIYLATE